MNLRSELNCLTVVVIGMVAAQIRAQEATPLNTQQDKVSYAIGVDLARNYKRQGLEPNPELVLKGLKDGLSGEKLLLSEEEVRRLLMGVQTELMQKRRFSKRVPAEDNKAKGEAFLAANKAKPGVVVLPNGLQYKVLKAGDGKKPSATSTVQCNYRGTLIDGTEFFCSKPGQPGTFKVNEAVVQGWKDALPLMPVGSKWLVFLPPQLAYGEQGVGRTIGPNETIICEIELLGIL